MAITTLEYAKAFFSSRDILDLIPTEEPLNDQTVATRAQSVVASFAVTPLDEECWSDAERAQITSYVLAANNLFEPTHRQYQYVFRHRRTEVPDRTTAAHSSEVKELERRRREHLLSVRSATVEIYQAIELLPNEPPGMLAHESKAARGKRMRQATVELDLLVRAYQTCAPELNLRRLDTQEFFSLFDRLLRPNREDPPAYEPGEPTAKQLRQANVYWDKNRDCLRIGRGYGRLFTLKEFPDHSAANLYGEVLKADIDLVLCTTWQPQERIATREQLIRLRTLMINLERNSFSTQAAIRKDPSLREVLEDAGVRDDLKEINELLKAIRRKLHTGLYSLTIVAYSDRYQDLQKPCTEIQKVFRLQNAQLHEETAQFAFGVAIPAYFGMLPGNAHLNVLRSSPLRNDHHAELSTIFASDVGVSDNHYANIYETRQGPFHRVQKRYSLVSADLTIGRTRSGKTTHRIDYIGARQIDNPITRIYDVGGSYEPLANYFHGKILRCSLGEWKTKISPFAGDPGDDNFREFVFEFCRFLMEQDGYQFDYEDSLQLHKKLSGLFRLDSHLRSLGVLQANLEGDMKYALARWIKGGQYGRLFDHPADEDELVRSDFEVLEFQQSHDGMSHPYLDALLLLLLHRDIRLMTNPVYRDRPKIVTLDEITAHIKLPRLFDYVMEMLQRMQRFGVHLSIVIQSPEGLEKLAPFVKQNCTSFFFFSNPDISDATLRDFGMDDARIATYRSVKRGEFLFHARRKGEDKEDIWKVLKLSLDPYRYWMSTTTPEEAVLRNRVIDDHGLIEGLKVLAAGGAA